MILVSALLQPFLHALGLFPLGKMKNFDHKKDRRNVYVHAVHIWPRASLIILLARFEWVRTRERNKKWMRSHQLCALWRLNIYALMSNIFGITIMPMSYCGWKSRQPNSSSILITIYVNFPRVYRKYKNRTNEWTESQLEQAISIIIVLLLAKSRSRFVAATWLSKWSGHMWYRSNINRLRP